MSASSFRWLGVLALLHSIAWAQPADIILLHGKIIRTGEPTASAIAVRQDRIVAVGSDQDMRALADPRTRIVDLGGRTVIPGLIDSHIHAIRAGLTWGTEVSWIGVRSLAQALDRLRDKARRTGAGEWLVVAGGWTPEQFVEGRLPTREEIEAVAPDRSVYVQLFYSRVLLNRRGAEALGLSRPARLPPGLRFESGLDQRPTGWIVGDARAISAIFDRLPRPTLDESIAGTRDFFRELNAVGLTGIIDPGGYNLPPSGYEAVFALWRRHELALRVRYSICAPRPSDELEDLQALTRFLPMGFGDDWLRFNGLGETVTWRTYNNDQPSREEVRKLESVMRWAASRGLAVTFHWNNDRSVHFLLDAISKIDDETPIADLRWSIAHLHDASLPSLLRMKKLGVGWLLQDAFYFRGKDYLRHAGEAARPDLPPIAAAIRLGLPTGAGTDAHRVMWFSPFVALQWMLDGKTIDGLAMRSSAASPSRAEALSLFTEGSAWFSFEERVRGSIAPGRLADLVVLDADYWTVPVARIAGIRSALTMVGGRIVYASEPFVDPPRPSGEDSSSNTVPSTRQDPHPFPNHAFDRP